MDTRKQAILQALRAFVAQRPGFDTGNYDRAGYRADSRRVTQQRNDFERLALSVETLDEITADDLHKAARSAFSGRLTIKESLLNGTIDLDYCTGQYWCTEYRAAACAVLASALWDCQRKSMPITAEYKGTHVVQEDNGYVSEGEWMRRSFRNWYGRGIQSRWFN